MRPGPSSLGHGGALGGDELVPGHAGQVTKDQVGRHLTSKLVRSERVGPSGALFLRRAGEERAHARHLLSRQPRAGRIGEKAYSGTYMGSSPVPAPRSRGGHGPGGGSGIVPGCSGSAERGSW